MALKTINDTNLSAIAAAIREKNQTNTTYKPSEMADAIKAISTGGSGLDIDWNNDIVATVNSASSTIVLPEGYTINDIKLVILPTNADSSYSSSTRWFVAMPGVITPEVMTNNGSSMIYNNVLPGIVMGAYGTGSQSGSFGIALYLIDHQALFNYSSAYEMKYIGLRTANSKPREVQGVYSSTADFSSAFTTSGGSVSCLADGKGLFVLKKKEVS